MPWMVAMCTAVSVSGCCSSSSLMPKMSAKVCRFSIRVSLNALAACSPSAERSTRKSTRRKRCALSRR